MLSHISLVSDPELHLFYFSFFIHLLFVFVCFLTACNYANQKAKNSVQVACRAENAPVNVTFHLMVRNIANGLNAERTLKLTYTSICLSFKTVQLCLSFFLKCLYYRYVIYTGLL